MKELLILSGKGGTGKTTIASAFIKLLNARAYADCDVDAPNLHLITGQKSGPKTKDYFGLAKAHIDQNICTECDICRQKCRFNAITADNGYQVKPFSCEGCGVCEIVCPVGAITLKPAIDGDLMLYTEDKKVFSTAKLKMGSGTSGLLVTEVKKQMKSVKVETDVAIIDGSPGIGCPVIASLSGVHMVLIVAEPSISGISDMKRIIKTAQGFGVKIAICINKSDTNLENTEKIKIFCKDQGLPFIGEVPFDPQAVTAINSGHTIVDIECPSGSATKELYKKTMDLLLGKKGD